MSSEARQSGSRQVEERFSALLSNAAAIRTVAAAVEGTLGPKGLDCMLVDQVGDVTITNDGSTILDRIDLAHPAARMLISAAKAQETQVGDGTTTATILAAALVNEGVSQALKGVPVPKILEGMRAGLAAAVGAIERSARPIQGLDDPLLRKAVLVAGRQQEDLAELAIQAARLVGADRLADAGFKLSDWVVAREGAASQVIEGLILEKEPMNRQMPHHLSRVKLLLLDDALEPEELEEEALSTEAGFARFLEIKQQFRQSLQAVVELGVKLVVVERGVSDQAEELLTEARVMVVRRVSPRDLARIADHTGARPIKRTSLRRPAAELRRALGRAGRVQHDQQLKHLLICHGRGRPAATMLVGASTREMKEERARIARDAASAAQQALLGGVVAGGGAAELAAMARVAELRDGARGMAGYGAECVLEALKRPLCQIIANAGFNPLEKVEEVVSAGLQKGTDSLAVNCESGEVCDMFELGVVDPAPVKIHALRAAGEVAEAVLRINTIIRKRQQAGTPGAEPEGDH